MHVLLHTAYTADRDIWVTEPLVRVSALLGGVAALYFATAVPEEHSGAEFLDDQISRIGGVLAAWEYYRGRSAGGPGPPVRFQMPDRMISLV